MRTKMPAELRAGDQVVVRAGHRTTTPAISLLLRAHDPPGGPLVAVHLRLSDGTEVTVTDLQTPVEVA